MEEAVLFGNGGSDDPRVMVMLVKGDGWAEVLIVCCDLLGRITVPRADELDHTEAVELDGIGNGGVEIVQVLEPPDTPEVNVMVRVW